MPVGRTADLQDDSLEIQNDASESMRSVPANSRDSRLPFENNMAFQTFSVKWPKAENLDFPSGQTLVRASILLVFCLETTFVFLH